MYGNYFFITFTRRHEIVKIPTIHNAVMGLYSKYTDDALVQLLQNGDERAFTEIYQRFWKLLFSVAVNKLDSPEDARELVQDVFIQLWKRHTELHIDHSIKSYLAAAVKFRVYTHLSKQYRLRQQQAGLAAADNISAPDVEDQLDVQDLMARIDQAATQLPERCRLVYQLSREDGLTHREIASQLDISEKTVENQITKALKVLRGALRFFC